jgi:hypothetical protein
MRKTPRGYAAPDVPEGAHVQRRIIGIQTHHSVQLDDATRGAANMCAGLRGALRCTGDPVLASLLDEATTLAGRIADARNAASSRLRGFYDEDPERFKRCRDGIEPWPDETIGAFQPRCSCYDRCLIHDHGVAAPEEQCNCGVPCPAHPNREAA